MSLWAVVLLVSVSATCGGKGAATDTAVFARAVGVAPTQVEGLTRTELPNGAVMLAGCFDERAQKVGAAVLVEKCANGLCAGNPQPLGVADGLSILALVDLDGVPQTVRIPPPTEAATTNPVSMKRPALLLIRQMSSAGPDGEHRTRTLFVVSADRSPKVLLEERLSSEAPGGEGFATLEVRLEKAPDGGGLVLILLQHALPRRGDPDYLPGPPLMKTFRQSEGILLPAAD